MDNLTNDEIAEILEEMDDVTREKILSNLEFEDVTEVNELLSYEVRIYGFHQ